MIDPFVSAVGRALRARAADAPFLLAVSGGADSMALLDAVAALGRTDGRVAHVDHGLRPDSADVAARVHAEAEARGLPVEVVRVDVDASEGGLEESARNARYAALGLVATRSGTRSILTAHTATDQAETLLLRLLRGTGRRGLAGMRVRRRLDDSDPDSPWLVRPLLEVTREETRAYCARAGTWFHDDPTNLDARPRSRLRADVLPVLESLQPGAVTRIAQAAALLSDEEDWLSGQARRSLDEGGTAVETLERLELPLLRRVLGQWAARELGSARRLGSAQVEALVQLVRQRRGEVDLPGNQAERCVACLVDGRLQLQRRTRDGEEA